MKYSNILLLLTTIISYNSVNANVIKERSNVPTVDELKKLFKEKYDNIINNGLSCIPLNSINPAFNPYHSSLIKTKSEDDEAANLIMAFGSPFGNSNITMDDKSIHSGYGKCGSVKGFDGETIACSVRVTSNILDSLSITGDKESFLSVYGESFGKKDELTEDILNFIDLSSSIYDRSENHLENVLNIIRNKVGLENEHSKIENTLFSKGSASDLNSIYESRNWSNNSKMFGMSNEWLEFNGYSNGYIMGHLETSNKENSQSDAISKTFTTPFNNKLGWLYGNHSNPYIFGQSNPKKYSNELSYDEAIDISAEKLYYKKSNNDRFYSITTYFSIPDNRCWNLTVAPLYRAEVNIWACGQYDSNNNLNISYKKSMRPVDVIDFIPYPTECNTKKYDFKPMKNYDDFELVAENGEKHVLKSGQYLKVNEGITSSNGKFIFGLLETGELVLRENNEYGRVLWGNGVTLPTTQENGEKLDYDLKLRIGENGHLMVTANEHIFDSNNHSRLPFNDESDEYIIWDSLPKDLPYNVGFPDNSGYILLVEEKGLYAYVNLYDGVGIKILEIKPGSGYEGYAFPREYNMPLAFDTPEDEVRMDKHNVHDEKVVKDSFKNSIEMNGTNIIKENEALVSSNGKYRFYLQSTGNMVIKEGSRTMWSSNTANVESFESPYKLLLNSTGEFVLYDKNDFALWQVSNENFYGNDIARERNTKSKSFKLVLSDEGELYVEDKNHNKSWSIWSVLEEVNQTHIRYLKPNHKVEIYTPNTNTTQPEPETKTRTVYIYNKKLDKCLISGSKFTYRPHIGKCNNKNAKWVISVSGKGFIKSSSKEWCLNVSNINKGTVTMRECDDNAIFSPIKGSVKSVLSKNKCLGLLESNGTKLNMNNCDSSKDDQQWECQTESGTYSKSPFLLRSAALLNDIMPVVCKRQHILFNKFKTNLSRNVNADNTVGQPSRANADPISDPSGIG
ncbi:hypothetical protein BCR32DRAFT_296805 [Anaeromyces robustus]|uniref:Bulb-type lectin domain-containing protein n=1 Tax=Anaeromyces robustus TaxID=1754192 RepID=A0A1Y1WQM6_9FUNG|nr:hypothetical protein BCR32DRAFT_296805 [Anaeromyces robustus]|eukprot:ORX75598.1 hypothetical protein BCR32DRAFT_296805 [Anaeromyces robustus]